MKAVRLFEHGPPSVLQYVDVDMPEIGERDVLIKVHATSINQWDLRYRSGKLPPNPLPGRPPWPLPFQLGRDAAGEVVDIGRAVKRWKVGDRVMQMPHPACGHCAMCLRGRDNLCLNTAYPGHQIFGGYADYVARPETAILPIPAGVSYETAAATMWSYTTPLNCATNLARVGPGDTVLITGASGGLASACVQLAKLFGATVVGTTRKTDRSDDLKAIGYDHVFDYLDPDTPARIKAITGGLGVDAVWETVGGSASVLFSVRCLRLGGTLAYLGAPVTDDGFEISLNSLGLIFGEIALVGVRAAGRRTQELCVELLGQGRIKPVIDRSFPLQEAAQAHAYLEQHKQLGKIILLPQHG